MVVYIDVLIVTNLLITYFLLLASSVVSGYTYNKVNIFISALIGAVFCLSIFINTNVLLGITVKLVSLGICALLAFGWENKRKLLVQTGYYLLLNMMLTGMIMALSIKDNFIYENNMFFYFNINPLVLVCFSGLIYMFLLILEVLKEHISPQKIYLTDVFFKTFSIMGIAAFYDSGFKVKDIVANKDVLLISYEKVRDHLPSEIKENLNSFLQCEYSKVKQGFVPVFFKTVSGEGMLPAIKAEYIIMGNRRINNIIVAFTANELSENVAAIFGEDIKKQL